MQPERWKQIEAIYHAALEREPVTRAAFLDEACAGDEILRGRVVALLAYDDTSHNFIEQPALELAAQAFVEEQTTLPIQLQAGQQLGVYQLQELLGRGGMGEVYLALDTRLQRKVAIKLLPARFTTDVGRVRRFAQEARAASALNHPNILTIHEIGEYEGTHYIVTEYIEGETLRQRISSASHQQIGLGETMEVIVQTAAALAAAHKAGIIHRDIKPENVMVRKDGYVKILDFGLAKLIESNAPVDPQAPTLASLTEAGIVMGTPRYMSPEQARGEKVDARTDIFSLGVVLYEMLAGQRPFEGVNIFEQVAAVLDREPTALEDVPPELQRIVCNALRKDREQRYQYINDLLLDLKDLRDELAFDSRLARERHASGRNAQSSLAEEIPTARLKVIDTGKKTAARTTSGIQSFVSHLTAHKRSTALMTVLVALSLVAGALVSRFWFGETLIDSIAVLPFANSNNDPNTEFLCDGISESLINNLGQLKSLKVIARSSSFQYKNKNPDPQEVAKALGVRAILTGSVARQGDRLLVSVELMDPYEKTHLWGNQYNQQATDLLSIQAEISREIAEKLRLRLTQTEQQQLERDKKVNPAAYELVLRARFAVEGKGTIEAYQKADEYLNQALALDPTYALTWVERSITYYAFAELGLDPNGNLSKARAAASKALELDEKLAEAHLAVATTKQDEWDWAGCERETKRAIELNPNLADVHSYYSAFLSFSGQHERAVAEARRGRELDPLTPSPANLLGQALVNARRPQEAIETLNKLIGSKQDGPHTHEFLGQAYLQKRMYAEAIAEYRQYLTGLGKDPELNPYLGYIYTVSGQRDKAVEILRRMKSGKAELPPTEMAFLYAGLGEKDQALAQLEKAYAARDVGLMYLVEPGYDSLRSEPRFQELVRKVGLMR